MYRFREASDDDYIHTRRPPESRLVEPSEVEEYTYERGFTMRLSRSENYFAGFLSFPARTEVDRS